MIASVSSEESDFNSLEKYVEETPIIENYGEELKDLFQVSVMRESSKVAQVKFSPLSSSQIPSKFSSLIEACGLELCKVSNHHSPLVS